jgi:hypothetical protein
MRIGYTQPTAAFTSHAVGSGPNQIKEKTINAESGAITTDKVDWMIRPLYKDAPANAATTATTVPPATSAVTQPAGTTGTAAEVTTPAASTTAAAVAAPTKAPVEMGIVVVATVLGIGAIRKGR